MPNETRDNARDSTASLLDEALGHALAIGIAAVLLIPAARGVSPSFGWLPLWLLGMPLAALAARRLLRFANGTQFTFPLSRARPRRPMQAQARRRVRGGLRRATQRVA